MIEKKFDSLEFKLNWELLEHLNFARRNQVSFIFENEGMTFIQRINCANTLGIIFFLSSFPQETIFNVDGIFNKLYSNSIGNYYFLESIIENMLKEKLIVDAQKIDK